MWILRRLRLLSASLLGVAAAASIGPGAANAGIVFCSDFPHIVYVAIAYPQESGGWLSRGWLEIGTGQCAPFDTAIRVKTFYYRATSESYRHEGNNVTMNWGDRGDRSFAVWEDDNFQYYDAEHRVLKSTLKGFTRGMDGADDYDIMVRFGADASAIQIRSGRRLEDNIELNPEPEPQRDPDAVIE